MVMMMTHPKVRTAVLSAKSAPAVPGGVVVARAAHSKTCRDRAEGSAKLSKPKPAAKNGAPGSLPYKAVKRSALALFARPASAVAKADRVSLAQMKKGLLAAAVQAKNTAKKTQLGKGSKKAAPVLAKPIAAKAK